MKKLGVFAVNTVFISIVPLVTFWWFFVPFAVISLFMRQFYAPISAGFILDLIYANSASNLPIFAIFGLILSLASIFIEDRLRF